MFKDVALRRALNNQVFLLCCLLFFRKKIQKKINLSNCTLGVVRVSYWSAIDLQYFAGTKLSLELSLLSDALVCLENVEERQRVQLRC